MTCPLRKLSPMATDGELREFDPYKNTGRIYFNESDVLDYHNYFLNRGTHSPSPPDQVIDFERANCMWKLPNGRRYHWPMTRVDCALGYDAVEAREVEVNANLGALKKATLSLGAAPVCDKLELLLYALSILSGDGTEAAGPPVQNKFPATECSFPETNEYTLFGAYFGL